MTKKKNKQKRERPSRREAERREQSGAPLKKQRRDGGDRDEQPFVASTRGGGGPPSQRQQEQARGAGGKAKGKGQGAQKQAKSHKGAAANDAPAAASRPKKQKGSSASAAAAAEADLSSADEFTVEPLDGIAIAFGPGARSGNGAAANGASSKAALANPFAIGSAAPAAVASAAAAAPVTPPTHSPSGVEYDSGLTAQRFFAWLIYPLSIQSFYDNYFEKKPLFISRAHVSDRVKSFVTLVSTKKELEGYLPQQEGAAPMHAGKAAAPSNKPAVTSVATLKTQANALKTERVTVVPVPCRGDIAPPAGAADASSSSSSASSPSLLPHYYSSWFSSSDIYSLLRSPEQDIRYGSDVDVTTYKDGVRSTLNPAGRATEEEVRSFMAEGKDASIRFLCPQKYSPRLWRMLHLLDTFMGMQTGANSYYTPRGTQGFAPHYDDVDILVIQTEGAKRWRLYPPRAESEILPSVSSRNFSQSEIGQPIMDVLLRAGDFLYAPRGTIHQCVASAEEHSLHVTLSTCLGTNWATFFQQMLPRMLQLAAEERVDLRRSLPFHFERFMGVAHSDSPSRAIQSQRQAFQERFMDLMTQAVAEEFLPFDATADGHVVEQFLATVVPPALTEGEKKFREARGVRTDVGEKSGGEEEKEEGEKKGGKAGKKKQPVINMATCVRLIKDGVASVTLHHSLRNSRLYRESPLASLEFPIGYAATLEVLLKAYPRFAALGDLPAPEQEEDEEEGGAGVDEAQAQSDLIELVESLVEEGLLDVLPNEAQVPPELRGGGQEEEEEEDEDEYEGEEDGEGDEDDFREPMSGEEEEEEEEEEEA